MSELVGYIRKTSDGKLTISISDNIRTIRNEVRFCEEGSKVPEISGGKCGLVSEEIAQKYGWMETCGTYKMKDGTIIDEHCWNILPDGSILDATADQFKEGYDIRIVKKSDIDFGRYREF